MDSATKGKPNFSDRERSILIDKYRSNLDVTRPKLGSMLTFHDKEEAWKKITDKLNTTGDGCRTVPEVLKKWNNLASTMKENLSSEKKNMERTGKKTIFILENIF